jgi:hypothetical protein
MTRGSWASTQKWSWNRSKRSRSTAAGYSLRIVYCFVGVYRVLELSPTRSFVDSLKYYGTACEGSVNICRNRLIVVGPQYAIR